MTQRQSTEARREQIADATLKIIGRDGVGGFTTLAIAREVGIAEGTIFRHFNSKQEVVLAAIARLEERLLADVPTASEDPIDDLGRFFRARMRLVGRSPGLARLFFFIFSPAEQPSAHLQVLSNIARMLNDPQVRSAFEGATDATALTAALSSAESTP